MRVWYAQCLLLSERSSERRGAFRDQALFPSYPNLVGSVMEMVGVFYNEMITSPR